MTLEQFLLFPLTGRFYSFSEIETLLKEATDLVIKPPVPVMAKVGRKYRRNTHVLSDHSHGFNV